MIKFTHDGRMPYPLGGSSIVFKKEYKEYVSYLANYLQKNEVRIIVAAVPNSSPHFGTITTFSLAFSLAQRLKKLGKEVTVMVGMVDTATLSTDETRIENVIYQKSMTYTGKLKNHLDDFQELLEGLSSHFGEIDYQIVKQSDYGLHRKISVLIKKIVQERERFETLLFPTTNCLGLRVACPQCGLADRHGLKNRYEGDLISFFCPQHGWHSIDIKKDSQKLEYETPLRNLIRGWLYTQDNQDQDIPYSWLRVTGSDQAGFYQEQFLYRGVAMLGVNIINVPLIVYNPLVLDWSGVKLSKSILVEGGYEYLTEQGLDYLINYRKFKTKFGQKGLRILFDDVGLRLEEPHRLFRSYSIFYFTELFKRKCEELEKGVASEVQ